MFIYSTYFAPFVDLYIIHYVFITYSTLNIVSFVYIYIFINLLFLAELHPRAKRARVDGAP